MQNVFKKIWSELPNKASSEMPQYFNRSPRLDAVRTIAEHSAVLELKLYRKSDYRKNGKSSEPIAEHEFYNLLDNPVPAFPEIDGTALKFFTFAQLELVGECAWLKIRQDNGKIVGLLPILKSWITETPTEAQPFYRIIPYGEISGNVLTVYPQDIVIFKDVNVADPFGRGKGLSESICDEIEADEYASKYQKNFFFNDATPPFVITGFQGNEAQAEKVKQTFLEKISGFMNARKPAVLTGSADVKTLGLAPKELDMVESRKFLRDECLHHYRLPPELMGIIENSNRSTIDASFYLLQKNVLPFRLKRVESAINRQLLSDFGKDFICKFDFECDEDKEFKLKVFSYGLDKGAITVEEFRTAFGLEPEIKDGTLLIPVMTNRVQAGEEVEIEFSEEEEVEIGEEERPEKMNTIIPQKDEHEAIKIKAWGMFDKMATAGEKSFVDATKKIATKQLADITKIIKSYDGKPIENDIYEYFNKDVNAKTKSTLASSWLGCMQSGRNNARALMGEKAVEDVEDTFLTNAEFNKWVETYGLEKSVLINDTTKKELVKKLKQILAEPDTTSIPVAEVKKRLLRGAEDVFEDLSKNRAMMIARTETGCSVNFGQMATYKANGMTKKIWLATYDDRTRDSHLYVSEQVIGMDDYFDVGGEGLQYPLDPNGSAGEVINCRCSILSLE